MGSGKQKVRHPGRHTWLSRCFGVFSTILLLLLVLCCLPLTVPRMLGCQVYSVISGSMEPAIPTGSLVYIREEAPEQLIPGDVIAFYGARDSASIITHRVTENRVVMGELVTKGDANQENDMTPVSYDSVIGKVIGHIPAAGKAAELFTSIRGKLLAAWLIGTAILLQLLAAWLERR